MMEEAEQVTAPFVPCKHLRHIAETTTSATYSICVLSVKLYFFQSDRFVWINLKLLKSGVLNLEQNVFKVDVRLDSAVFVH